MTIKIYATRLTRGCDLKQSISDMVKANQIKAGSVASCVGCVSRLNIRLAGANSELVLEEPLEIVSVMATLTPAHQHIHIAVSKQNGQVIGGHLLAGTIIDTTAELILHGYPQLEFSRQFDDCTGYTELEITPATADQTSD
ncbi:PPC domain-containing DNA-binding protein [Vibrio sp. CAU 1672]|uniref:PPC domain-containing DNA-binding protein n=1 Tax=Vibrio sp. CAU 1672 TaxID=3032594 RepID=UPI0023D98236|nr:PPC domain-containing DNA-binding protein [Vibrio sp. CAU 1672]MDF2153379.1 DNA-binding protein [Vibrio sp. CAU 1672]